MSGSAAHRIKKHVGKAVDLCRSLLDATRKTLENFSPETIEDLVRERALLIMQLASEKNAVQELAGIQSWNSAPEFVRMGEQIAALDRSLTDLLTDRMNAVRRELASLSNSSSAARAYVRHSR